jgi:Sulfotransferase family
MRNSLRSHKVVPVFVGGTGRSGTTVIGDLLGKHSKIRTSTPIEIKFLTNRSGLVDVVFGYNQEIEKKSGKVSILNFRTYRKRKRKEKERFAKIFAEFNKFIWEKWWDIDAPPPHGRGLVSGISKIDLADLLARLERELKLNRKWAARRFMKSFIRKQFDSGDEIYWVETTPMNIPEANKLQELFPSALFINMVRDPRDVIASLLTKKWGPTTPLEGLEWIENRLLAGHEALSAIKPNKKITIALEDLAINSRDKTYKELLGFLKISDEPAMQKFFVESMTPDAATSGRWKGEIDSPEFSAGYEQLRTRLERSGVHFK